jgi:hypothetical protein
MLPIVLLKKRTANTPSLPEDRVYVLLAVVKKARASSEEHEHYQR